MIFIEEKYYIVWLSLIKNLGIKKYINLINKFKTNKNIFNATKADLIQVDLISNSIVEEMLNPSIRDLAKKHLSFMQKNDIQIISISDNEYPYLLREIYSPPISIYVKGNVNCLVENNVSIIGCRECSDYGKSIAQKLAYDLATNNNELPKKEKISVRYHVKSKKNK